MEREAGRGIGEKLFWAGMNNRQARTKEDLEAGKRWDYQEAAQIAGIPIVRNIQHGIHKGNTMKIFPLGNVQSNTNK